MRPACNAISGIVEELPALKREYGAVEVVMLHWADGYVPATVNVTLEQGLYEALIEP